jgi:hypothetical protein
MGGQHVIVSEHLAQDFVKQNVSVVQNFSTMAQENMQRKHTLFRSEANSSSSSSSSSSSFVAQRPVIGLWPPVHSLSTPAYQLCLFKFIMPVSSWNHPLLPESVPPPFLGLPTGLCHQLYCISSLI